MGERMRILIVEDNLPQAIHLTRLLERCDYELSLAANAGEGLAVAQRFRPDVIITDAGISRLGGFDLCRRVKRDETLKGIPVILVTSSLDPEDLIQALNARADYYLARPFDEARLADAIECVYGMTLNGSNGGGDDPLGFAQAVERFVMDAPRRQVWTLLLDVVRKVAPAGEERDTTGPEPASA
jgi:DNA-binding response OmpR family regulator